MNFASSGGGLIKGSTSRPQYLHTWAAVRAEGGLATVPPITTGAAISNLRLDPAPAAGEEELRARCEFRDSAGHRWQRDEQGRLRELRS